MDVVNKSRKFRVRYGRLTELTEVPGRYTTVVTVPRVLWHGLTELKKCSGTGTNIVQNSLKFRVRYGSLAELAEVLDRYTNVVPAPRVLWHGRTELTENSGTGMKVVHNSHQFRAWVWMIHRTHRSSG